MSQMLEGALLENAPVGQKRTAAVGVAVGNSDIKVTSNAKELVIRSQSLAEFPDQVSCSDKLLFVEAVDSPVFSGRLAVGAGLSNENGVRSLSHKHKAELYAQYALAAIAHVVDNGDFVNLAVSLPTSAMKPAVEPLKNSHTVIANGKRKHFLINAISFYPEGLGAATRLREKRLAEQKPTPTFTAIDVGFGNFSVVCLDTDGRCIGFKQTTPGVNALYAGIAKAIADQQGGIAPTIDAVRAGVELRTLQLGGYGEINFQDIYEELLPRWFSTRLDEVKDKAGHLIDQGAVKVVCGGGALLPYLKEHLPNNYVVAIDSKTLESQGLYGFAKEIK